MCVSERECARARDRGIRGDVDVARTLISIPFVETVWHVFGFYADVRSIPTMAITFRYIDCPLPYGKGTAKKGWEPDGVHMNIGGYHFLAINIASTVQTLL